MKPEIFFLVMLAKAGIQEFYLWIFAGVYPDESQGMTGMVENCFNVGLKSTFF